MVALRRAIPGNLLLTLVSTMLGFAVLEIGLRVAYGHPPRFLEPQVKHRPEPYGYKPRPNQEAVYTLDKPVRTNAFGFRDSEWSLTKPAGTIRVLVIGDSFTFGNNNVAADIYPNVLEDMLRERFGNRIEVLNTSAQGWDLDNEAAFWLHEGIRYAPDIVVIGFFLNDLLRPRKLQPGLAPDGRVENRPEGFRWIPHRVVYVLKRSALVTYLRDALRGLIERRRDFVSEAVANTVDVQREPRILQGRRLFGEIALSCHRAGITLVIAAIPPLNLFLQPRRPIEVLEAIRQFAGDNGVEFVDLAEPFWAEPDPTSHYGYPWDNHFIGSGHRLAARGLYPAIASLVERRLAALAVPPSGVLTSAP
jgi:hypothetical protein